MAGTSTKSKVVTGRVTLDLAAWMEAQPDSVNDLVVRALQALRQASMPKPRIAGEVAWCGLKKEKSK